MFHNSQSQRAVINILRHTRVPLRPKDLIDLATTDKKFNRTCIKDALLSLLDESRVNLTPGGQVKLPAPSISGFAVSSARRVSNLWNHYRKSHQQLSRP